MSRSYASLPQMNMPFNGAKLAILINDAVITILRDARPNIPFPNLWDLPGGGREGDERPETCVLRETEEELGLLFSTDDIEWGRVFEEGSARTWFFVLHANATVTQQISFGDEGQCWRLMPVQEFIERSDAIPHFQDRLRLYRRKVLDAKNPPLSS